MLKPSGSGIISSVSLVLVESNGMILQTWRQPIELNSFTSPLLMVRSSPGAEVLPVIAPTPASMALPTAPFVGIQYLISSGITSMTEMRGSFSSPLCVPSFKSPK